MTAAILVASSPFSLTNGLPVKINCKAVALNSAEARKRRRFILASQRNATALPDDTQSSSSTCAEKMTKKRRQSEYSSSSATDSDSDSSSDSPSQETKTRKIEKKTQIKYDPDVPMTKDEETAWRREQRRKRNRESAAASRQRQRDRISELEVEIEQREIQYRTILERIRDSTTTVVNVKKEQDGIHSAPQCSTPDKYESDLTCVTPRASPLSSFLLTSSVENLGTPEGGSICQSKFLEGFVELPVPPNLNSRPAVSRIALLLNLASVC
jgi:bZIP transcription factor